MAQFHCPHCGVVIEASHPIAGKLVGAGISALAGKQATKSVEGAVVGFFAGLALGHVIDKHITPDCGAALKALTAFL